MGFPEVSQVDRSLRSSVGTRAAMEMPDDRSSERLACRVVGQHRSGQCHPSNVILIEETKLRK